jgi:hypothetical protein
MCLPFPWLLSCISCGSIPVPLSVTDKSKFSSCIDCDACEFDTDFSQRKEEARVAKERKELAWQRDHAYDDIMTEDNLAESSNQDRDEDFLDDFM